MGFLTRLQHLNGSEAETSFLSEARSRHRGAEQNSPVRRPERSTQLLDHTPPWLRMSRSPGGEPLLRTLDVGSKPSFRRFAQQTRKPAGRTVVDHASRRKPPPRTLTSTQTCAPSSPTWRPSRGGNRTGSAVAAPPERSTPSSATPPRRSCSALSWRHPKGPRPSTREDPSGRKNPREHEPRPQFSTSPATHDLVEPPDRSSARRSAQSLLSAEAQSACCSPKRTADQPSGA